MPDIAMQRLDDQLHKTQRGIAEPDMATETVVWLHPTSFAMSRRLGQPARWCNACTRREGADGSFR